VKGCILTLLFLLTSGVAYCAWRQGMLADVLPPPSPRVQYVERERAAPRTWTEECREYETARDADWRRWRNWDAAYQRALVHTGVDDIDEAAAATYGADFAHPQWTPTRWRERWDAGSAWCERRAREARERDPGPDEEKIGSSGPRPRWAGSEKERTTRKIPSRSVLGYEPEEREGERL
jgi:hypothetical protein